MIYATVRNRKIHVKKPDTVVQNGVNVDWLELDMDDEWKNMDSIVCVFALHYTEESTETTNDEDGGYTVTTVITEKEVQKEMLHTFGEPVLVPWECLEKTGMLSVNCTGYVDGEKVMTTAYPDSYWEVVQNGPMSGEETLEPTPSLYDQIVAAAGAATAAATAAEETRNQLLQDKANGVFDGKDGKSTTVTVGNTTTGSPGTSAQVYATGTGENMVLNFTIPRGDPGPVPSTLPNPYPLFLDIDGVQVEYDGSQAVAAQVKRNEINWGTAMMKQLQEHNESPNAHQDIREAIPERLPNPHALDLTINGVRVEYDGSEEVTAKIEVTGDAGGTSGTDVDQAINNHNDDASAHPAIRDMIPTVPEKLPNPKPLQIDYTDEDGSVMGTIYTGDANVTVSQKNLTAYPIAQHNQSTDAHQDIRRKIPSSANLDEDGVATFFGPGEVELFKLDLSGLIGGQATYGEITVSAATLNIDEGGNASFAVSLATAPSGKQTVYLAVSDGTKLSIDPTTLTFDTENYSEPQTVTLTALQDDDDTDDVVVVTLTSRAVDSKQITVSVSDDDKQIEIATDGLILYADYFNWDGESTELLDAASGVKINLAAGAFTKEINGIVGNGTKSAQAELTRFDDGYGAFANAWNAGQALTFEWFGNVIPMLTIGVRPGNIGNNYVNIGAASSRASGASTASPAGQIVASMFYALETKVETSTSMEADVPNKNDFIHAVLVCDQDGKIYLYYNGVKAAEAAAEDFSSWPKLDPTSDDTSAVLRYVSCLFGTGATTAVMNTAGNWCSSQRIYNRALTEAEINNNMIAEAKRLGLSTF